MQYMLLIYGDEQFWASLSEAEVRSTMQAYVDFSKALAASGALRGGYYLIDVPTLDEAIAWAARIPSAAHGCIEIRPQTANQALTQVS